MLLQDKGNHEDLTAPLLVITSVMKDKFQERNISKYTYEVRFCYMPLLYVTIYVEKVIGGIQRFSAIRKVNKTEHGRKITSRKCAIYSSGLNHAGEAA